MDRLARGGLSAGAIGQLDARAAGAALVAASQARRPRRQFFDDRLRDRRRADRPRRTAATRRIWRLPALSPRSEEHTSELQSLMRISYAVFCLKKKNSTTKQNQPSHTQKNRRQQIMPKTTLQ